MKVMWAVAGAAAAVTVLYQIGRARSAADSVARTLTPAGLTDAITRGVAELTSVGSEIAAAMREQEQRLAADLLAAPEVADEARTYRAARAGRRTRPENDPWDLDEDF